MVSISAALAAKPQGVMPEATGSPAGALQLNIHGKQTTIHVMRSRVGVQFRRPIRACYHQLRGKQKSSIGNLTVLDRVP